MLLRRVNSHLIRKSMCAMALPISLVATQVYVPEKFRLSAENLNSGLGSNNGISSSCEEDIRFIPRTRVHETYFNLIDLLSDRTLPLPRHFTNGHPYCIFSLSPFSFRLYLRRTGLRANHLILSVYRHSVPWISITFVLQLMMGVGTPLATHCMSTVSPRLTSNSPDVGTVSTLGGSTRTHSTNRQIDLPLRAFKVNSVCRSYDRVRARLVKDSGRSLDSGTLSDLNGQVILDKRRTNRETCARSRIEKID